MKIPKEYSLLIIIGLFVFAYVLDSVVKPLSLTLKSPYEFFTSETMALFPYSTASIIVKTIALFLTPLWLFSFSKSKGFGKPAILLIWASLIQLYAVQNVATKARTIPLEWSFALAAAGFVLLFPTVYLFLKALLYTAHRNLTNARMQEAIEQAQLKSKEKDEE
jgi:hypothetical protein